MAHNIDKFTFEASAANCAAEAATIRMPWWLLVEKVIRVF